MTVETRTPAQVVKDWRTSQGMTIRKFSEELSAHLPQDRGVSVPAVQAWENQKYELPFYVLIYLRDHAAGWVADFARDALAAIGQDVERRR